MKQILSVHGMVMPLLASVSLLVTEIIIEMLVLQLSSARICLTSAIVTSAMTLLLLARFRLTP